MLSVDDLHHKFATTCVYQKSTKKWVLLHSANRAGFVFIVNNYDNPGAGGNADFLKLPWDKANYYDFIWEYPPTGFYILPNKNPVYLTRLPLRSHKQGISLRNVRPYCPHLNDIPNAFLQEFPAVFTMRLNKCAVLIETLNSPALEQTLDAAISSILENDDVFCATLNSQWSVSSLTERDNVYRIYHGRVYVGDADYNNKTITPREGTVFTQELVDFLRDTDNRLWAVH